MNTLKLVNSKTGKVLSVGILLCVFFLPSLLNAQVTRITIPCNGPDCDFEDLMRLIENVINFLITLSVPIVAIAAAYAGYLMVTAGGSDEKIKHAKRIFSHVFIGFMFVLFAWLIVHTITTALIENPSEYTF